jgi:hypothetical protein
MFGLQFRNVQVITYLEKSVNRGCILLREIGIRLSYLYVLLFAHKSFLLYLFFQKEHFFSHAVAKFFRANFDPF